VTLANAQEIFTCLISTIFGDAFFDVSVINICADSYVTRAAKGVLEGSSIRYVAKMKKYPDLGPRFKPLILKSTGV
jgi:hypothetical protein